MRVALISDIHGNLLALDAVLADLEREQIDQIICLGDVPVGPQPSEALARVRKLRCSVIMGNWDACFLQGMPAAESEIDRMLVDIGGWCAGFLSPRDREFIESFKPRLELQLEDGTFLLCFHGSPRSFDDWIFATTGDSDLGRMLAGFEATVMAAGHTHVQMIRRHEGTIIVNPGSVGLPFRQWWPKPVRIAPWAEYGILTCENGRLGIDLRRTSFDVDALLELTRESGMPHTDWWISCWTWD